MTQKYNKKNPLEADHLLLKIIFLNFFRSCLSKETKNPYNKDI